jgi:tetratricopeptide (TPR) repeat protein
LRIEISLILVFAILFAMPVGAKPESMLMGPYKVSFDLGNVENYTINSKVLIEQHENIYGISYTKYGARINGTSSPFLVLININDYSAPVKNNAADAVRSILKNNLHVEPSIVNRTIDGRPGVLGYTGTFSAFIYPLSYYPQNNTASSLVMVISTYPWDEGTSDLVKTINVENYQKGSSTPHNAPSLNLVGSGQPTAEAWNNKGLALFKQGNYGGAIQAYDTAIQLNPQFAEAWNGKGKVLIMQGKYDEAIQAFDKAIKLNQSYAEAWNDKGIALEAQRNLNEAIQAFDKAIELNPQFAEAWYDKGGALNSQGKYDEAIQACDKAIELTPDFAEAWVNKGFALGQQGKWEEAFAGHK